MCITANLWRVLVTSVPMKTQEYIPFELLLTHMWPSTIQKILSAERNCFCGDFKSVTTIQSIYVLNVKFQIFLSDFNNFWTCWTD